MQNKNDKEPPLYSTAWREQEAKHTVRLMGELCGYRKPSSKVFGEAHSFGKGHFVLTEELPAFLWRTNLHFKPTTLFPFCDVMHRWYLLNSLLVLKEAQVPDGLKVLYHNPGYFVTDNRHLLATILGFALLEELSFRLAKKWDSEGLVTIEIDNPRILDSSGKPRKYKVGSRLSDFRHKLILMEEALTDEDLRTFLVDLNKKLEGWLSIQGVKQEPRDLYTRLYDQRNRLAHGASNSGWEGWLISLLVKCIYLSYDENFVQMQASGGPA